MADQQKSNGERRGQAGGIPPLEWAVALIGLILVVGTIAFLLYQAATGDESPPNFRLMIEAITEVENGYLVEFSAYNQGSQTVARLMVEGQLRSDGEIVETSQAEIDYVPAGSERRGGLFFTENPDEYELALRPLGFQEP